MTVQNKKNTSPSLGFSLLVIALIASVLTVGIVSGISVIPLLTLNIVIVVIVSMLAGHTYAELEEGLMQGIHHAIGSVTILLFVGVLIAGWMLCGTVPMLIYYGLGLVNTRLLLPLTFVLCTILSLCTGSSWGTAGTVGIACVSIGSSMNIPVAVVAGAAISGSILGDKLSPISDSTILAASASDTGLFQHVRSMAYTTIPSMIITLILFFFIGSAYANNAMDPSVIAMVRETLAAEYHFNLILLLPMVLIVLFSVLKVPALPSILVSGLSGLALAVVVQGVPVTVAISAMLSGSTANTGVEIVDTMLNKGGITAMLSTVCTAILALGLGGILSKVGYLHTLVEAIVGRVKTERGTVALTLLCGAATLCLVANFYVSVVLAADMFGEAYDKRGIHRSVLSRTLEEANTIMLPLVPWNTSAVYYMGLFGFETLAFAPYLIFAYVNIIFSLICVTLSLFIFKSKKENPAETDWKWR